MVITMVTQRCPRCTQDLPENAYHPDKWGTKGHYCKACVLEYKKEWRKRRRGLPRHPVFAGLPGVPKKPRQPSTSYTAVHLRISKIKGPASRFQCACGARAAHWAYQYTDPTPLIGRAGHRQQRTEYSADPDHYQPMCRSCHTKFDTARGHHCAGCTCQPPVFP